MAKKPVILTNYDRVAEDEVEELIARNRQLEDSYDPYYIPGYTEIVKANEIANADDHVWHERYSKTDITKAKVLAGIGANPQPLPVNFTPLRVSSADGTSNANVTRDLMPYSRWGYRPAIWPEDFTKHGFGQPPGYTVRQDGTLHRDDLQLFVVDGRAERARQESLAREARARENPESKNGSGVEFTGTTEQYSETVNFNSEE
jgi:hypothetical protein